MQNKSVSSAVAFEPYRQQLKASSESPRSLDLQSFCQLQIEQLASRYPIFWAQIIYYDPLMEAHQKIANYAQTQSPFPQETLAYLQSEVWLRDFPPAFTLNELSLDPFTWSCYICPLGHRAQKPEYILLLAYEPLSSSLQQYVKQSAVLLSKYLEVCLNSERQQSEIQLLEHIIQRAGHQVRNPLALIGIYAQNLFLGLPTGPWQEQAKIICETIRNLDNNLNDLIYCGQTTKLRLTLQDLRTLIAESVQGLKHWINQKKLKIIYPEPSTTLAIDYLQIKQVFDNLLSNAIHGYQRKAGQWYQERPGEEKPPCESRLTSRQPESEARNEVTPTCPASF